LWEFLEIGLGKQNLSDVVSGFAVFRPERGKLCSSVHPNIIARVTPVRDRGEIAQMQSSK